MCWVQCLICQDVMTAGLGLHHGNHNHASKACKQTNQQKLGEQKDRQGFI